MNYYVRYGRYFDRVLAAHAHDSVSRTLHLYGRTRQYTTCGTRLTATNWTHTAVQVADFRDLMAWATARPEHKIRICARCRATLESLR